MPTPTPHMNGGHRSKLPVLQSSTSSSYPTNLKRTNDELRQHISRLKAELEVEKAKSRQVHRNRVADIKKLKDQYDMEKLLAQTSTVDKIKTEHDLEIKKLRESLQREKEVEIKQILKFKDEELRTTKKMMAEDKEFSLKEQDELLRREFNGKSKDSINEVENKLRLELNESKKQKQQFEELYKNKLAADSEKTELLRKLKEEHEKENQKILRDARMQIARNVHELKIAQKALAEKEQEMTRKEIEYTRLEEEKDQLLEKVKQNGELPETGASKAEKEWELQLKNMELKKKVDELSRKLNLLEKEASGGKSIAKDGDLSTKNEQRMKELRKRNGELVNLARKLEDKAKRLQEELKEVKSSDSNGKSAVIEPQSATAFETFKKTYTVQRARDLAEHAKALMTKDKEITELKKRIVDLEEQLSNSSGDVAEKEKLEMIIHQIEKEKLRLEKAFADKITNEQSVLHVDTVEVDKLKQKVKDAELEKKEFEELISTQKKEIKELSIKTESLNASREKCEELQILLAEKEEQHKIVEDNLSAKDQAYQALERSLEDLKAKNLETERQNEKSRVMVATLQNKLNESTKRLVQLESLEGEYESLQERLSDAEKQCVVMQSQLEIFQEKVKTFKRLEEDLKENEEKCRKWERDYDFAVDRINKQNKENSELHEAQKSMKESYGMEIDKLKDEITRLEDICVDLESKENDYKVKLLLKEDELKSMRNIPTNHVYVQTSRPHTPVEGQKERVIEDVFPDTGVMLETEMGFGEYKGLIGSTDTKQNRDLLNESGAHLKSDDDILDIASSRIAALAVASSSDGDLSREDELSVEHEAEKATEEPKPTDTKVSRHSKGPIKNKDTSDELSLSLDEVNDEVENVRLNDDKSRATPKHGNQRDTSVEPIARKRIQFDEGNDSYDSIFVPVPTRGSDDGSVVSGKEAVMPSRTVQTGVDTLSVFIAKYTYDPLEHSPNDDPSLELALEAGDYVYVFGDADEDGFYTGELVDGQRGLVPSNFVEKIADESELIPFANGYDAYPGDESDEDLTEAEYFKVTPRPISTQSDSGGLNDDTDLDSGDELELKQLAPPKNLKVDRQLKNSVVVSWLPPDDVEPDEIKGYVIRADGELKEKVIGASKTKVIVSDINREKTCRLTVHCFGNNEKEPEGEAAVITVGRGASAAPSDIRVLNLSANSADLEWTCGNSSMAHVIYLDGNEVHVVKPGTDRFRLVNLIQDHEYEVCVEARSQGEAYRLKGGESLSNGLIFRTPKAGPPEPPLNVQVRVSKPSPHLTEDFIFVSWLPVTIIDAGTSKVETVTGYKIYMNDREVLFIDQPTEDHAKILVRDVSEILADVKFEFIELWMRTQSMFGESTISNVVILPVDGVLDRGLKRSAKKLENADTITKRSRGNVKDVVRESDTHTESDEFDRRSIDGKGLVDVIAVEEERIADVAASNEGLLKELAVREEKESAETIQNSDMGMEDKKTKQAKVIRYHVTESDESEDSDDENESDDEDQCVFNILTENQNVGSESEAVRNVDEKGDVKTDVSPSVPENLILPSLPIRDDAASQSDSSNMTPPEYPDATEVKPRRHFPLDDLLSSSDSELSAIEEETIEDLLQYDKDGNSRSTSKSHNLLNADGSISRHSTENMTVETEKSMDDGKFSVNLNKTFSINSDDKDRASSQESRKHIRSPDKVSERKGSQTSKDSLTFSSEDVIDLLDKDIVDNVPDLPRDDDKELVTETDRKQFTKLGSKVKEKDVPVTDLSDLSCDEIGEARANGEQVKESFDSRLAGASGKGLDTQKAAGSGNLPAKQTPVESKDQENISAMQLGRKWTEEVAPAVSVQFAERGVSFEAIKAENQVASNDFARRKSENNGVEHEGEEDENRTENVLEQTIGSDAVGDELGNIVTGVDIDSKFSGAIGEKELNEPMGQTISLDQCSVALDNTDLNNEEPGKAAVTSARDLYTLNAIDSFEDSESEAHAEFNPYFAPISVSKISDQENMGLGDTDSLHGYELASSLKEQPAIENRNLTEHSGKGGIASIGEALGSVGDEATNNGDVNDNEIIEDTRPNHVDGGTKPTNVRVFIALFAYDPITMSPNTDGVEEELAFAEGDLIKIFGECDEDGFYYGEVHDRCGFVPSNMVQEVSLSDFGNSFNIPPPEEDISGDTEEPVSTEPHLGSFGQSQTSISTSGQQQPNRNLQNLSSSTQGAIADPGGTAKDSYVEPKDDTKKMDNIITNLGDINIEDTNPDYRYISERDSIYCLPPTRMIALYDYDPSVSSPNVDSEVELPFNKGDIILVFGDMDEDGFYAAQSHNERGLVPSNFLTECPELSDSEEIEIDIGAASPSIQTSSRKSSAASVSGASPVDSPKTKKKKGLLAKGKKIFSKLKGK